MAARVKNTAQDWHDIKADFLRLYIDENMTLDEVSCELSEKRGFVASKKAYKIHITKWKAFKNYKSNEKEELVRQQQLWRSAGAYGVDYSIRGRLVKWDRVERYKKAKSARRCHQMQVANLSASAAGRRLLSGLQHQLRPSLLDFGEQTLSAMKQYLEWQLSCWGASSKMPSNLSSYSIHGDLSWAMQFLDSRPFAHRGWHLIHKSCESIRNQFTTNAFEIWQIVLSSITNSAWRKHSKLVSEIFSFVRGMGLRTLPSHNPFRQLLSYVTDLDALQGIANQVVMVDSDLLMPYTDAFLNVTWVQLILDSIVSMIDSGCILEAQQHLKKLSSIQCLTIEQRLDLLHTTAYSRYRSGDFKHARNATAKLTQITDTSTGVAVSRNTLDTMLEVISSVYNILASVYSRTGEMELSLAAHKAAFETSSKTWVKDEARLAYYLFSWENAMYRHRQFKELQMLGERYNSTFELDQMS